MDFGEEGERGRGGTLARERAKFHETKSLSSSREFYIERLYGVKDKLNALRSSNFLNRFLIYLVSNSIDRPFSPSLRCIDTIILPSSYHHRIER